MNKAYIYNVVSNCIDSCPDRYLPGLDKLLADLREDIRAEACKVSGKADVFKAAKAIVATVSESQPQFKGAFMDDGKQCFCDGSRLLRLTVPIDFKAVSLNGPFDTARIMEDRHTAEPLALPLRGEIKSYIAVSETEAKAKYGKRWRLNVAPLCLGVNKPAVNARYLMDMLTAMPYAKVSYIASKGALSPLFFDDGIGDGLLLPIRKKEAQA